MREFVKRLTAALLGAVALGCGPHLENQNSDCDAACWDAMQVAWERGLGQGELTVTDRTLDVALVGSGYFEVSRNEDRRLTRDGAFIVDEAGFLATAGGWRVRVRDRAGASGPLRIEGQMAGPRVVLRVDFVGKDGELVGTFDHGAVRTLGWLEVALPTTLGALVAECGRRYRVPSETPLLFGTPGQRGRATAWVGVLESLPPEPEPCPAP